jgi:biopolymer transport protein ExbD
MSWSIRHQGSPRSIDGLRSAEIISGLEDGLWEVTDEVKGAADEKWVAIEEHARFAEIAYDLEPPPVRHADDETRLDMNPLIDVTLVLLIFFILTTSYAALERFLEAPRLNSGKVEGLPKYTAKDLSEFTIKVSARRENGKQVVRVEDQTVAPDALVATLRRFVKQKRKTTLWLDIAEDLPYGMEIQIRDAAKGAGIDRILAAVPNTGQ